MLPKKGVEIASQVGEKKNDPTKKQKKDLAALELEAQTVKKKMLLYEIGAPYRKDKSPTVKKVTRQRLTEWGIESTIEASIRANITAEPGALTKLLAKAKIDITAQLSGGVTISTKNQFAQIEEDTFKLDGPGCPGRTNCWCIYGNVRMHHITLFGKVIKSKPERVGGYQEILLGSVGISEACPPCPEEVKAGKLVPPGPIHKRKK